MVLLMMMMMMVLNKNDLSINVDDIMHVLCFIKCNIVFKEISRVTYNAVFTRIFN